MSSVHMSMNIYYIIIIFDGCMFSFCAGHYRYFGDDDVLYDNYRNKSFPRKVDTLMYYRLCYHYVFCTCYSYIHILAHYNYIKRL